MKLFTCLLFFSLGIVCLSQEQDDPVGVLLKDVHYAPVTDVVVLEKRGEVYSADTSGKILIHDQQTGDYLSTFKQADNVPISRLLSINDERLTIVKKYYLTPNEPIDSLYTYELDSGKMASSSGIKGTFKEKSHENYLVAVVNSNIENGMVIFQRNPYSQVGATRTSKTVQNISFLPQDSVYVFTQNIGIDYKNELVVRKFDGEILHTQPLKESRVNYKVLFENSKSFLLFEYDQDLKTLSIFRYQLDSFAKDLVFQTKIFLIDWRFEISNNGNQWILFSGSNSFETPVIHGSRKKGAYKISKYQIDKPISHLYIAKENLIRGFINSDTGRDEPHSIIEFNIANKRSVELGRSLTYGDNRAFFLANGDYILQEYNSNYETNIRYYKASTFQNKYNKLKFDDWLQLNKGIDRYDRNFSKGQQEFQHNSIAFMGKYADELRLIDYNLDEDTFSYLSPVLSTRKSIVDYSSSKKLAIVVDRPFTVTEYPSLRTLEVCTEESCYPMKGLFLKAVLSENGELLATIDQKFLFEIRNIESQQLIYSEQLVKEQGYEVISIDTTGFAMSVQPPFEFNKCVKYTVIYEVDENQNITSQKNECFEINAFAYNNEKVAIGIDSYGIVVDDQKIPIDQTNPAVELSLNNDASLLFVSHAMGNIDIYDTTTNHRKAQWILEDDERQLLVSDSGYYLANFNASDLLTIRHNENGKIRDYLKPDEVLKTLGDVNEEYLAAINKAEEIRTTATATQKDPVDLNVNDIQVNGGNSLSTNQLKNNIRFTFNGTYDDLLFKHNGVNMSNDQWQVVEDQISLDFEVSDTVNHIEVIDKDSNNRLLKTTINYNGSALEPVLHVLAVGVSQYEQSSNNLTFADKDALDIARFYGDIPKEDIQSYYDKFYAEPLSIHNVDGEQQMEAINKFDFDIYGVDLKYLGANGRYWYNYNAMEKRFYLFDFKDARVSAMNLPAMEQIESVSFDNDFVSTIDGDAFYFLSNSNWNRYDVAKNSFEPIDFPFDQDLRYQNNNLYQLNNDRWLLYEANYNGMKTEVTLTLYDGDEKEIIRSTLENDQGLTLLSVSSEGSHFLFKDFFDVLHLYSLDDKKFSLISTSKEISIATLDKYFINVDDQTISQSEDSYENEKRRLLWKKYDFDFQLLEESKLVIDLEYVVTAIVDGGELLELRQKKSLANKNQVVLLDKNDAFAKAGKPASFKKTTVTYLLNEQATQESIQQELKALKSKVRPQDQVMVFFAGHGVLDQDLNYYYAPHDMDFNEVTDRGVSFDDIIASLGDTQSTKMLLLMDTCHSGNTLDMEGYEITKANGKDGERGGIAKRVGKKDNPIKVSEVVSTLFDNLNTVNGVTVLSASSGQDVAFEARDLSNGAFTTAYMQQVKSGLSGRMQIEPDYEQSLTLSPEFVNNLRVKILELTNNKQEMDIRERNELTTIRLW